MVSSLPFVVWFCALIARGCYQTTVDYQWVCCGEWQLETEITCRICARGKRLCGSCAGAGGGEFLCGLVRGKYSCIEGRGGGLPTLGWRVFVMGCRSRGLSGKGLTAGANGIARRGSGIVGGPKMLAGKEGRAGR